MTKITVFVFILLSLTNCANTLDSNIKSCIKNGKCSTQIHEEKGYEMQFQLPSSVEQLVKDGYLKQIPNK